VLCRGIKQGGNDVEDFVWWRLVNLGLLQGKELAQAFTVERINLVLFVMLR